MITTSPTLRIDEQRYLLACIRRSQCCAIVGPSNSGKSHLLRSLLTDEVRQQISPPDSTPIVLVPVDCLMATEEEGAFYELILRQVIERLPEEAIHASTLSVLQANHQEMLMEASAVAQRSLFVESIHLLLQESELCFVIILDELDDALTSLPPWPLRVLRALRDESGDRLSFITATSRRLERIRADGLVYEFREMFHLQTIMLRPLSEQDSQICFNDLAEKQTDQAAEGYRSLVLEMAGGHPGLIKRIYLTLVGMESAPSASQETWLNRLLDAWPVQQECQRLWDELEIEEQEALLAFASGGASALDVAQRHALEDKSLLVFNAENQLQIFSPLFNGFILRRLKDLRKEGTEGVRCDFDTGKIWLDGKDITLEFRSDLQRRLLRFLYRRANTVCTHQEIIDAIWEVGAGVTVGAINMLVKRVRKLIESDPYNPQHLVTVTGEGYMLKV